MQDRRGGSETLMGYPVDNKIDKETELFVYIGANAIEENRQEAFNRYFKEADVNATLMPLNIREEDLGFFIHNFKNSKIKAAYFSQEYWPLVAQLLHATGSVSKDETLVDSLAIVDGAYEADFLFPKALVDMIAGNCEISGYRIALIGASELTHALVPLFAEYQPCELVLYDERVENLLPYEALAGEIPVDINRIQNREIEIRGDIIIDTIGKYQFRHTNDTICTLLTEAHPVYPNDNVYRLRYDDIFDTITEIKTREWIENGRF
jgi:shikimate 5-dehydrogenase